jgi:hypothetical protein
MWDVETSYAIFLLALKKCSARSTIEGNCLCFINLVLCHVILVGPADYLLISQTAEEHYWFSSHSQSGLIGLQSSRLQDPKLVETLRLPFDRSTE